MKRVIPALLSIVFATAVFAQQPQNAPSPQIPTASSTPSDETVVEEIVARVNDSIITMADLKREHDQIVQEVHQQNPPDPNAVIAQRDKNVLRDLISQQLLVQKGRDLGISVDTDVIRRLDELRKEMHASSMEDLEKIAEQQGISFEDFKQNLKNQILSQKVIAQEVGGRIQITHEEAQKWYDAHKKELDQPESVRLSEILVGTSTPPPAAGTDQGVSATPVDPTPEQIAAAKTKADEIYKQLKAGAKFADLAHKDSNGPTASQGGDLGYFKRGMLAKQLEDVTFAMKEGQYTEPIRTKQGWVILEVTEHTTAGVPPLDKIENQVMNAVYEEKIQPALKVYLTKLREDAYINIRPGYVDTGASPNQTNLIYTSAESTAEANAKGKLKKKKHFIFF